MKVAVIADDLTGAAELAGAAADAGLTAEVQTRFDSTSEAEVVAIDSDTRGLNADAASCAVETILREVMSATPNWIYKKTDSVLRGNVRVEIEAVLRATSLQRALLVPANPSKGRVIREGIYHINGVPLSETSFAADPHHPRTSSYVHELLGRNPTGESLSIVAPDAATVADLQAHAAGIDSTTLPAGGVEFFQSLLSRWIGTKETERLEAKLARPILFICGSPQACRNGRLAQLERHQMVPCLMPTVLAAGDMPSRPAMAAYVEVIRTIVRAKGCAAAAIGDRPIRDTIPEVLALRLAEVAATILRTREIATICIEGGATAAAVLRQLSCTRLAVVSIPSLPGVAALRAVTGDGPLLLVKPGSYPWPEAVFHTARPPAD